jgi:hypothetical protein
MLMCIGERIFSKVSLYNIYNIQKDKELIMLFVFPDIIEVKSEWT